MPRLSVSTRYLYAFPLVILPLGLIFSVAAAGMYVGSKHLMELARSPIFTVLLLVPVLAVLVLLPVMKVYTRHLGNAWLGETTGGSIEAVLSTLDHRFVRSLHAERLQPVHARLFVVRQYPLLGDHNAQRVVDLAVARKVDPAARGPQAPPYDNDFGVISRAARRMSPRARAWGLALVWVIIAVFLVFVFAAQPAWSAVIAPMPILPAYLITIVVLGVAGATIITMCFFAFLYSRNELRRGWLAHQYGGSPERLVSSMSTRVRGRILTALHTQGLYGAYSRVLREYPGVTANEAAAVIWAVGRPEAGR